MPLIRTLLPLPVLLFLLIGCSSGDVSQQSTDDGKPSLTSADSSKYAMEYFIAGTAAEAVGDYNLAVMQLELAASLQESAGIYHALAKNYFYLRRLAAALPASKKAVELEPENLDFYDLLQEIYRAGFQEDSAAAVLEKMIALDSSQVQAYYKLAQLYDKSKPLKAAQLYEKLLDLIGDDWSVLADLARIHERLGNLDKSIEMVNRMLVIDPSNTELRKMLAQLHLQNNQPDSAMAIVNELLQAYPDDIPLRMSKAEILSDKEDFSAAALEYQKLLSNPEVTYDAKVQIGAMYFVRSFQDTLLLPETKAMFETIAKDTAGWEVKMHLGAIAVREHQDTVAIEYFDAAKELAPWNVEAWIRLAGLYFDNRRYDEAKVVLTSSIERFPDDFYINLLLGFSYSNTNEHESALPFLRKAVRLEPDDINALSGFGFTLNRLGINDTAVVMLKKAIALDPSNVNLLGTLGSIYDGMKNYAACDSVYEAALAMDSTNALINNNFAYSLSVRNIRLDDALRMVDIALSAEPESPSYLDTKGWVYYRLGRYQEAKEYVLRSLEKGEGSAEIFDHLGDISFQLGDQENALLYWEKALEKDPKRDLIRKKIETKSIIEE